MSYDYKTSVNAHHAGDDIAFDNEYDFDPLSWKQYPFEGLAPDPQSDLYWRMSSNEERKNQLERLSVTAKIQDQPDPVQDAEIHPTVAYVDLDGPGTDDSAIAFGEGPGGQDLASMDPEDRNDYFDQVQEALTAYTSLTMDDDSDYDEQLDRTTDKYNPEHAAITDGDSVFGDEISEVDGASEDQVDELLTKRFGMDLEDLNPDPAVRRALLKSKVLMDFERSAGSGALDNNQIEMLKEQFKNGTILVNGPSEKRTKGPNTSTVVNPYVIGGQLQSDPTNGSSEELALDPAAAAKLAHTTLESMTPNGLLAPGHQGYMDYVRTELQEADVAGQSDLFQTGRPFGSLPKGFQDMSTGRTAPTDKK